MKKKDLILLILCLALAVFGAVQTAGYFSAQQAAKQTDERLREMWHAEEADEIPTLTPQPPAAGPARTPETPPGEPEETLLPVPKPEVPSSEQKEEKGTKLRRSMYPDNPGLAISERFRGLRKTNRDIIGWLSIGKMQDEAVTQRDNEFYMNHDASGKENISGAVFLDENVSLRMRPYTLILYGHNMRDESRFGWLRKYENPDFYRKNLFIDFQTLYEDGRYVIFSEGTVSTEEGNANYLDFFELNSLRSDERARAIGVLRDVSVLDSDIDVRIDDQILVLVTCVDKETDRRVVAARRIREDEDESQF